LIDDSAGHGYVHGWYFSSLSPCVTVVVAFQLWTWGRGGPLKSFVLGMVLYFAKTGIRKHSGKSATIKAYT
jgi:hypothetical protein